HSRDRQARQENCRFWSSLRPRRTRRLKARALLDRLQLFAGFESHGLAGRNGHFGAGARIASNAGFARANVEDAKAAELDAVAFGQRTFHALEDGFDGHFGLGFGDARPVDDFINDVELDHVRLAAWKSWNSFKCLMLRNIIEIINGCQYPVRFWFQPRHFVIW